MEYPAKFTLDEEVGVYVVTFPDVPEAVTQGVTMEEAMRMAQEALEVALSFYTEQWKDLPTPSAQNRSMRMVRIPALSAAKLALYQELRTAGIKKVELARRLACAPSQVDRLLDITHNSRLDQIEKAFAAIGKKLDVMVRAA